MRRLSKKTRLTWQTSLIPGLADFTTTIVVNYVGHNKVEAGTLGELVASVYRALQTVSEGATEPEPEAPKPDKAVIKKSLQPNHLISFIDGRHYKSLKRHIGVSGMTPDEYRTKFGLPKDYPMIAPAYSAMRSELAKSLGLGRKPAAPAAQPAPAPKLAAPAKRGRPKAMRP